MAEIHLEAVQRFFEDDLKTYIVYPDEPAKQLGYSSHVRMNLILDSTVKGSDPIDMEIAQLAPTYLILIRPFQIAEATGFVELIVDSFMTRLKVKIKPQNDPSFRIFEYEVISKESGYDAIAQT